MAAAFDFLRKHGACLYMYDTTLAPPCTVPLSLPPQYPHSTLTLAFLHPYPTLVLPNTLSHHRTPSPHCPHTTLVDAFPEDKDSSDEMVFGDDDNLDDYM